MNKYDQQSNLKADIITYFPNLTIEQVWTIVKLSKYVRLRARNNSAFNNLFNNLFPEFQFREETKYHPVTKLPYKGLKIKSLKEQKEIEENPDEEI